MTPDPDVYRAALAYVWRMREFVAYAGNDFDQLSTRAEAANDAFDYLDRLLAEREFDTLYVEPGRPHDARS